MLYGVYANGAYANFKSINYKFLISLVYAKWGPKLTIALQSVTTRKGGSGPNRFHYDRWVLSRRPLQSTVALCTAMAETIVLAKLVVK